MAEEMLAPDDITRYWVGGAEIGDMTVPIVYVAVNTRYGSGDVTGSLVLEDGEGLWGHFSSHTEWLIRDLTIQFPDRREELLRRFPDGYQIVLADRVGIIPDEVWAANQAWGEAKRR